MVASNRGRWPRRRHPSAGESSQPAGADASESSDLDLLLPSGLFDLGWYNRCTGRDLDRERAVDHYLREGRDQGFTPHPLFDPATYAAARPEHVADGGDPLAAYLRRRAFRAPVHPLFRVGAYVEEHPQALEHPLGPVGHYVEQGARAGARPNEWYLPDPGSEPRGLVAWVEARRDEWLERRRAGRSSWARGLPSAEASASDRASAPGAPTATVTVVLAAEGDQQALGRSVASLLGQTWPSWELLVAGPSPAELPRDPRLRAVASQSDRTGALNEALRHATGTFVTWLTEGDEWEPGRLERLTARLTASHVAAVYDVLEDSSAPSGPRYAARPATPARLRAGARVDLGVLMTRRELVERVGALDEQLPPNAAEHDLVMRVTALGGLEMVPAVGVRRDVLDLTVRRTLPPAERPWLDHATVDTWHDVVLNRHLLDWDALAERAPSPDLVSVVMATHDDWRLTHAAVRSIARAAEDDGDRIEVVVVDNGCHLTEATVLQSLPERYPSVRVVTSPVNRGFALGNNLALGHVQGSVVVFLNTDTVVRPGWLAPLRRTLEDPDVLGAQSLLVHPDGTIQSAGVAYPEGGGVPHALLQGFPAEDARHLAGAPLTGLTAAAVAMRYADVVALHGFDPVFRNGMEDADLALRLRQMRAGHFEVVPDSVVVHLESGTAGRFQEPLTNRKLFLERWAGRLPEDDVALWRRAGYDLVGHEIRNHVSPDPRLCVRAPVLARAPRVSVHEGPPSLRWAIKNPAPTGPAAEIWGDTHFARSLATALRGFGQEVVIDHRPAFDRDSGRFDDVVLVLRGLEQYRPAFGQVNLLWLISHPELFARSEAVGYDRIFAAGRVWAEATSQRWGLRIEPLLQATDPTLFHPDLCEPDTGDPVLFVGSSRNQMRPMVRQAVEAALPLSVYGGNWERLLPPRYVRAAYLPNEEVGRAYRAAGVVLNDHWDDMRASGFISNRLFDATACGARVITDDVAGLEGLFGRSVQVARSAEELAALASAPDLDAVFGDDAERRQLAARVREQHSFQARARVLLDAALEIRGLRAG